MFVKTVDFRSPQAALDFVESMRETGFAVLSHHPLPQYLVEQVYEEWEQFFNNEKKFNYLFDPATTRQAGYFPFKSENAKGYTASDLKEFYHYRDEQDLPAGMKPNTQILLNEMSHFANEILQWMEAALPQEIAKDLSMPLSQMTQGSDMTLLRILHYPPLVAQEEEGAVRSAAHEDIVMLTILPAATAPGLQVKDSKGNWHEISCDPGTLVFNAGDMLQMASKGYYKSTTHRVVNPAGLEALKSRYSMPLFLHARPEVSLSDTHTALSYLGERLAEIGLKTAKTAA
jgi:isopenicillin N synthase-like dioxygenase